MQKLLLLGVLTNILLANDYLNEIKPMIGYVDTKNKVDIKNHKVFGIGLVKSLSEKYVIDELEFSLLQSKDIDYKNRSGDTKVTLLSINGIKDYKITNDFKLYALAGLGYERISDSKYGNESDPFFNYGVGLAYSLPNDMAIKLDARHELKFDNDKNIIYTVGLSIPFGQNNSLKRVVEKETKNNFKELGVLFEVDSSEIKNSEISKFKKYVKYMKTLPNAKIVLEGHTDSTGTESYNLRLSKKRANNAKQLLLSVGVNKEKITTIGYGETKPFVLNDSIKNRAQNRRVVGQMK
jgi:OOP family OmpA-OmpF porin